MELEDKIEQQNIRIRHLEDLIEELYDTIERLMFDLEHYSD